MRDQEGRFGRRVGRTRGPVGPRRTLRAVLLILLVQLAGTHAAAGHQHGHRLTPPAYLLLCLGPLALWVLRGRPVAAFVAATAVAAAYLGLGYPFGPVVLSVAAGFARAVLCGHRRAAWSFAGACYLAHLLWVAVWGRWYWSAELLLLGAVTLAVLATEAAGGRIEQRRQRARAQQEWERRLVEEQRLAIARELHDVLAHSISLIHVQAGVALELMDGDPEQARTALTTIKQTSRQALGEVRQVLGTLRPPGTDGAGPSSDAAGPFDAAGAGGTAAEGQQAAPRDPVPGLDRLPELAAQAAVAGLTVTTRRGGAVRPLPPGVDLAAFRIVQEALTNVLRHSSARSAEVALDFGGTALELTVRDPGPPSAAGGARAGGTGAGLIGMRERAASLGGSVSAGPEPGGPDAGRRPPGYLVRVVLPVPPADLPAPAADGIGGPGAGHERAGHHRASREGAGREGAGRGRASRGRAGREAAA